MNVGKRGRAIYPARLDQIVTLDRGYSGLVVSERGKQGS